MGNTKVMECDCKHAFLDQEIIRLVLTRPTWHPATNTIELTPTTAANLGITVDVDKLLSAEDIFAFVQSKIKQSLTTEKIG